MFMGKKKFSFRSFDFLASVDPMWKCVMAPEYKNEEARQVA